jgi:hypothetical protein
MVQKKPMQKYEYQEFLYLAFAQERKGYTADEIWALIDSELSIRGKEQLIKIFTSRDSVNQTKKRLMRTDFLRIEETPSQGSRGKFIRQDCYITEEGKQWWDGQEKIYLEKAPPKICDKYNKTSDAVRFTRQAKAFRMVIAELLSTLLDTE